ncbi:hypothetical protein, partial [Escherichia coli]|uniref:hypothetical protein n=1 Tax=Escherichia coli TaxID=562 RepID=UPI0021183679
PPPPPVRHPRPQPATDKEYLVYRYDPKTFYGSYATGSLDKLPLLSPEFENKTIRFSVDGREKDCWSVGRRLGVLGCWRGSGCRC